MSDAIPIDITDQIADLNDHDLVFEYGGYKVKVKSFWTAGDHGAENFKFSGSIVGDDGKAILRLDGTPAIYKFERFHTAMSYDPSTDVNTDITREQFECVRDTVNAHGRYMQIRALRGVGRPPEPAPATFIHTHELLSPEQLAATAARHVAAPEMLALPPPDAPVD